MKKLLVMLLAVTGLSTTSFAFDGPYFQGIWEGNNLTHPVVSAGTLLTTKGDYDGVTTQVALIWHKGDPKNSLVPESLQKFGLQPVSFTLLNCGAGYGNGTGNMLCGSSLNVGPTVMGPLGTLIKQVDNPLTKTIGSFLDGSSSGGVALGYVWNMTPVLDGAVQPFNRWGSHLDVFLGATWNF